MAEKHKSKYKKPENTKYKSRKDLKDYTMDDKDGGMNPKSTKDKQLNVLRKTDKEMVDTGDLNVKYNAEDRLYKDLENAEYEPKDAAKKLKKRQDTEEKETTAVIKDKIENLTREQKERLVREYVRRKIAKILIEQPVAEEPPAEEAPAEAPTEEVPTETPADPAAAAPTPAPAPAPAPEMPAVDPMAAPVDPGAPVDPAAPAPEDPNAAAPTDPSAPDAAATLDSTKFKEMGNVKRIGMLSNFLNVLNDMDVNEKISFFLKLRKYANNEYSSLAAQNTNSKQ